MTDPQESEPVPDAPSAMVLKQRLANLSAEKLAALQRRLQQQERSGCEPVCALRDECVYPLSLHQQRLWFIEQFQPGTPLYNMNRAIRLRGSLNRGALKSALQSLVHRHEALRTTFVMLDGEPVQRINASPELPLPVVDLRAAGGASENAESLLQQRLTAEGRRTFDLSTDLMLRAVLYQVADDEHVLQVTIHHLNCDGWSLQLLFNELSIVYRGFCTSQAAELPPLQTRYVDFARWQREPRQQELLAERVQWWKHQLAGAPPVLELAIDRPRPQIESVAGAVQRLEIPSDLLAQLRILGREEGATLYMTLLAGFFILLHRYSGMEDFLVGSATAGRNRLETQGIVGFFVDTVVLRADLSGQPTVRQVLQRVRRTVIDAVEHGDVPFERVVDSLDLPKDLSRHPLFQVMFNAPPQYSLNLHDLNVSPVNVDLQVSRFDLEMTYSEGAGRTTGMRWNTDLFDPETIQRMLRHYCVLLKAMIVTPDQSVGQLPLLTARERQQLLVEWNDTARDYPRDKCVHHLFAEQVERTPDAIAVVFQEQEVTYRELNARANQLANYLRSRGVGPETLVGLCLERSVDLVVGILGILKAGGAYVPLDVDYPVKRLESMLADAQVQFLVTQERLLGRLPATPCQLVCVDSDAASQDVGGSNPSVNTGPDNLAYVIYTSGSTGQPKGVAVRHTSIARLVFGNDYATFGPERVFLQLATASFDASTFELWGSLLHGAKLVIAPAGLPDFAQLEDLLKRHRVTTLWLTATFFNQVVEHNVQALHGVQEVLTGGEALSAVHIRKAQAALGSTLQLVNGYGPTESTTFTTCYRIPQHLAPELESISIGRPIANTTVYVLDRQRQPVPTGVPGELYIGGAGLARGYLNRPELTAEKFIPHPFSDDPAARLYRTGDLCRWRADGNLEFLGRLDDQVKLRGFRIELGEIEAVLNEHPAVAHSVVVLREDRPGDKRLVGYCVPARDATWNVTKLTHNLRTKLPDYMVPSAFVTLPAFPLTPSGKINRRALPAPDESRPELETAYIGPRSPLEEHLASIWCEVLGVERVGIHDNFFALGGHSLLATRVNVRIATAFQIQLPLRRLFEAPTIAELAAVIGTLRPGGPSARGTPSERIDRNQADRQPVASAIRHRFSDLDVERSVVARFEQQAELHKDRLAVTGPHGTATYRELNCSANRLAHVIRMHTNDKAVRAAALVDNGAPQVTAILGSLKAGACFVPLDAGFASRRTSHMLKDSEATILITNERNYRQARALASEGTTIIKLDDLGGAPNDVNLSLPIDPGAPACVLYTSGSTGEPKGVIHSHRNVLHNTLRHVNTFDFVPEDRQSLLYPTSTYGGIRDVFNALLNGVALYHFPVREQGVVGLADWLIANRITVYCSVVTVFRHFVRGLTAKHRFPDLRAIKVGGERLDHEDVVAFQEHFSDDCVLHYGLGSTETGMTLHIPITKTTRFTSRSVPMGKPVDDIELLLLDEHGESIRAGEIGEIVLRSRYFGLGYHGKPDLSDCVFRRDERKNGYQLFVTGDLGVQTPEAGLVHCGRKDLQVKIRGNRVELREVEVAIERHQSIREAIVTVHESGVTGPQLIAHVVPAAKQIPSHAELRSYLSMTLNDYMIPSVFVVLDQIPLTPIGKVDRAAAAADFRATNSRVATPAVNPRRAFNEQVAPRTPLEQQLAAIWREALALEEIGVHDNFLELGGHSLLATEVAARASETLGVPLTPRSIFDSPTIAGLAAEINAANEHRSRLANTTLKQVAGDAKNRLPLSFGQQRMWFLEQMEGELTAYNMPFAWRLRGPLDTEALRRALAAIVRRHEALRTTFGMSAEEPVQVIGTIPRLKLPIADLSSVAGVQQETEIVRRSRLEAERPFDLTRDLMLRAALLRVAADEHVLLLTMHHIASDGWSLRVLWRELGLLYDAFCRGIDADLPDLPAQYADYSVWQGNELQGPRLQSLLHYWRQQLDGVSDLELPTDRPRPPVPTYQGARHDFTLRLELVDQLQSLSQREGVTLHMTLLAAFQALLARYSGQDDIAVGTPIAGRNHAAFEDLIGFFVNTLVLRTNLASDPTFRELLLRVREVSLAAYDHQDLPFEKLVEELQPQRRLNRGPLFQVLFQVLNFSDQDLVLRDLESWRLPSSSRRVRFDLEMHLRQQQNQVHGAVVYSTDLFDQATIERMVGHFVTLLAGIVADADQRLSQLPLLTKREHQQLLVEWNNTARDYPRDKCVHHLFAEQVERTPDAIAVVFQEQEVTYRELNARANQLANYLRSRGVGPETLVGLCLERSVDLVVGILGILKAGGAYVPLDVDYPVKRLESMLADAQVQFLVTQERLLGRLPATPCQLVCVDSDAASQDVGGSNPSVNTGPDNLAYVIYTSGSTGQPKGVQIPHSAVVNLLAAMAARPGLTSSDRLFSVTTATFDISVLELLLPLTVGACLDVVPAELASDAPLLAAELTKSGATVMQATPVTWQMLISSGWDGFGHLKALCGGEALLDSLAQEMQPRCGELWNMYGPTETTIWSTTLRVHKGRAQGSIGRPIANTTVYVLDRQRQPVPIGVPGELYIGGAGLARGYLNRPELTAEKFVPNPFSDDPAARLYRTGDLCRWRADGNLEFLGRLDDQVKLRGFRIELGEIEAVLNEHPAVAHSVVVLREDRPGDKRLVAYCVPAADATLDFPALRSHLRNRLPDYMLPAAFVSLARLPLTSNGKVNRRALPAADESRPESGAGYVAPSNAIEQRLAAIWCELLGRNRVGVDDDFFDSGGHSLSAVRMIAHIEKLFGRKLPLAVLFHHGTIRHLAKLLVESGPELEAAAAFPLQPEGDGRPLFLMPSIGGELLFSRALLEELAGRCPVVGIQPALTAKNLAQFSDFRTTARCFVNAMRTYQPHGPYALAGFSYGGMMAFEVARLLAELGEKVDLLAVIDTGPGRRGAPTHFGDPWRRLLRIVVNLPFWLREEVREFSASRLVGSATRKLRHFYRWVASRGRKGHELDDVFDVSHMPPQNLELMRTVYAAFRDYVPRPYAGRLTLFRATTRPLLSGSSHELGWRNFVAELDIRPIKGNHETILHRPHISELARQLGNLLDDRAACLQSTHKQPDVLESHSR